MDKKIAKFAIIYFVVGVIFAFLYAWFYHWGFFSLFSPGFYAVVLTWPAQVPHFFFDFQTYGLNGKTLI